MRYHSTRNEKLSVDSARAVLEGLAPDGGLYMLVAQAVYAAEKFLDTTLDKKIIDNIYKDLNTAKENI